MLKSIIQEILKSLIVIYGIPRIYRLLGQTTKQITNH